MATDRALIVHRPTTGLRQDRTTLADALRHIDRAIQVFFLEISVVGHTDYSTPVDVSSVQFAAPFDCVFLLEDAQSNPPLTHPGFARRVVYVPNIEWILPLDEASLAGRVDAILLKNEFSLQRMQGTSLAPHAAKARVVGWSSPEPMAGLLPEPRHFRGFLHVNGTSLQKQTATVIETWRRNPGFPELTVVQRILPDPTAFTRPLNIAGNIVLHGSHLASPALDRLQHENGVHVCPSAAEGFGHTLNEARARGRVLVTTDAPPMRDMVVAGTTGFLVACKAEAVRPFHQSLAYPIDCEQLAAAIRSVLRHRPEDLLQMGRLARAAYLRDREAFFRNMKAFWHELATWR